MLEKYVIACGWTFLVVIGQAPLTGLSNLSCRVRQYVTASSLFAYTNLDGIVKWQSGDETTVSPRLNSQVSDCHEAEPHTVIES
jgi:hypothetical protein